MKAKFAAIAVISLLILSVIGVGLSAVREAKSGTPAAASADNRDDGSFESAFKMVCPFH